jgi:molybdopterin-guanine dinucleotide biosynthesis protein A
VTGTTGILLAGGESRRFPPNKLLENVDGEPLFWRALRALASTCDEVVVMVGATRPEPPLPQLSTPARIVRDRAAEGPLAAVADALAATARDVAVVVAGDAPDTPPSLLRAMVDALRGSDAGALALREDGAVRPLPVALRPQRAARIARGLVDRGIRRLGVLVEYGELATDVRDEDWWSRYDAAGGWRRDVDEPADLRRDRDD